MKKALGYSLLEIIVTTMIIGILASLALPRISFSIERSRSADGLQTLQALLLAQVAYEYENPGTYASDIDDLDVTIPASNNFDAPSVADDPSAVASVQRNGSGGYDYILDIDEDGVVYCDNQTSPSGTCTKLGY
ncbi:MAG: type II secretion system protein [Candidatus Omnitrophica bacterium]|nr:type II secretion system protein [Candidatus Omnitrophota bacterium]